MEVEIDKKGKTFLTIVLVWYISIVSKVLYKLHCMLANNGNSFVLETSMLLHLTTSSS